jgi:Fe2+ or Zn2+ uptake regulation protein
VLNETLLPPPAPEILDYLARHPDAQDTIDGILHWWVLDACVKKWAPTIAETVAQLVEQGFLEQKRSADGKIFYHVSPHYLARLQQRPPRNSTPDPTP